MVFNNNICTGMMKIELKYTHETEKQWTYDIAGQLADLTSCRMNINRNSVEIPPELGNCTMKCFILEEGFRLFFLEGCWNQHAEFVREIGKEADSGIYTLTFNLGYTPSIGGDSSMMAPLRVEDTSGMCFSSLSLDPGLEVFKHKRTTVLKIAMSRKFILKQCHGSEFPHHHSLVQSFLKKKPVSLYYPLTGKLYGVLNNIIHNMNIVALLQRAYFKGCVLELLALSVNRIILRRSRPGGTGRRERKRVDSDLTELNRLLAAKDHLIRGSENVVPTIMELSRKAGMSATKFKKMFKQVFNMPPYEYYQYTRMEKAKELLEEEHYSVSEVGYRVGFTSLGHFTAAFKKHFGRKPSDYLREIKGIRLSSGSDILK